MDVGRPGLMELLKALPTLLGALFIFTLGLLAWRHQLLDKRKFEVAEQVVVYFAKMAAQIRILRQRHGHAGMAEFVSGKVKSFTPSALGPSLAAQKELARREFIYRIPDEKRAVFNELAKEYEATIKLARLYLSDAIADYLTALDTYYQSIELAAAVLPRIYPNPSADRHVFSVPLPDTDLFGIETVRDEAIEDERRLLPYRFHTDGVGDTLDILLDTVSAALNIACRPYTEQGPYKFLWNFGRTLLPNTAKLRAWSLSALKPSLRERP
jgi:hypothetical protein